MHVMTGNLSFQIEHHLFPDLPSNRYQEIAPQVRDIFDRYGLTYVEGSLPHQVASAWHKVLRLSLPNGFLTNDRGAVATISESVVVSIDLQDRNQSTRAGFANAQAS